MNDQDPIMSQDTTPWPCDHHSQHRIRETTINDDEATDQWECDECGEEWTQTRGVTYGEMAESVQNEVQEAADQLEAESKRLREEGDVLTAQVIERRANSLRDQSTTLDAKRQKMPFGLDSARGIGVVMESLTIDLVERLQREESDESK